MKLAQIESDEGFALRLLKGYLADCGESRCRCEINADDPPDLVVTRERGERWEIEVTRVYQQVEKIRKRTGTPEAVSSESVAHVLRKLAERLEQETEKDRRRGYLLYLEGPGTFSTWDGRRTLEGWKNEVERCVKEFVASGETGIRRFRGGTIRAKDGPGTAWKNMIGHPAVELVPAVRRALHRALADKVRGLRGWQGDFDRTCLLLLNCYVLADDPDEVAAELGWLVGNCPECAGFDGIFWSGYPDRTLIPIKF